MALERLQLGGYRHVSDVQRRDDHNDAPGDAGRRISASARQVSHEVVEKASSDVLRDGFVPKLMIAMLAYDVLTSYLFYRSTQSIIHKYDDEGMNGGI